MLKIIAVFLLLFLPPILLLFFGSLIGLFTFDWLFAGGIILGWVTFLAAVFQILGLDLKTFLSSGNVRKRKIHLIEEKTIISKDEITQFLNKSSDAYPSPLILLHTLSPIPDDQTISLPELRVRLMCNIHIFSVRIEALKSLGLVEIIGESVKRSAKGNAVVNYIKDNWA